MNRDREAIARIIDPEAWARIDGLDANEHMPQAHKDICAASLSKRSLAKADAILALPVGGGVDEALPNFCGDESLSAKDFIDDLVAQNRELREALAGVVAVADRNSPEFRRARAALSPTTLGGRSGSAQDGLPPARSLPSALTSAGPATGADQ